MSSKAKALYERALEAATKKNPSYEVAFDLLRRASKAGNPEATYALATWYLHGRFVRRNLRRAVELLRVAAGNDVSKAIFDLAVSYEKGIGVRKSETRALDLYLRSALLGDQQSVYEVGRCYYYGIGVRKSRRIADIWLTRAGELGVSS